MVKSYAKFGDFEVRDVVYLGKYRETSKPATKLDVVKWYNHEPMEVINAHTGKKEISTRACYSLGFLEWDEKEGGFDFESCGLRFFDEANTLVCAWLSDFCKQYAKDVLGENCYED